ncbi:hypothetical protein DPMN_147512 [Dreissena polymorpha]|uniref:Uncharacterized protein n=1 Tax=Dreissena polymorpha TaxID=45954 RepID=A0A9D4J314_DREPO|nr:hypothetical protein DPMN_147512 [Dreissena polymorpha]
MFLDALLHPQLKFALARKRNDYGIDAETFPINYTVSEQAQDNHGKYVHNIEMGRQWGQVD